jgi:hypothetical protein
MWIMWTYIVDTTQLNQKGIQQVFYGVLSHSGWICVTQENMFLYSPNLQYAGVL